MDATINTELEREVETARSRLAADLMVLRAPQTLAEFGTDLKQQARDAKDALVEKARAAAASTTQELIDGLKARVAANPAAVLLIGAGLAWRLVRRPPIATALVGAGLYSLLRSRPLEPARRTDAEYVAAAKLRLREQVTDLTAAAKERALTTVSAATERASDLASAAGAAAQQWAGEAAARTRELPGALSDIGSSGAAEGAGEFAASSVKAGEAMWSAVEQGWNDDEIRDKALLAIAGIAIAAALGIAGQRC